MSLPSAAHCACTMTGPCQRQPCHPGRLVRHADLSAANGWTIPALQMSTALGFPGTLKPAAGDVLPDAPASQADESFPAESHVVR